MADDNKVQFTPLVIYPKRTKLIFALIALKKKMLTKRERRSFFFFRQHLSKNSKKIHQTLIFGCKKGYKSRNYLIYSLCCGETGIRTLETLLTFTHFPGVPLQPLEHLSVFEYCKDNTF